MLSIRKCCIVQVFLVYLNYVGGMCPYATQMIPNDIEIYDSEFSPMSYDTYETVCHRYVPQPPPITGSIIANALKTAIDRTKRYIQLDVAATAVTREPKSIKDKDFGESNYLNVIDVRMGELRTFKDKTDKDVTGGKKPTDKDTSARKFFTDMDRINYFFESATKYIQETTCASKITTTNHLSTLQLELFNNSMIEDITETVCEDGHIKYPSCEDKISIRQVDGTCNNLESPLNGCVGDCMLRLLPPDFKDGVSQLKTSIDGSPLPNPRIVSTNLFGRHEQRSLSTLLTQFHAFFGEFVISDNGATLDHGTGMLVTLQCCDEEGKPRIDHPQCAPFFIPPSDDDSSNETYANKKCMQFARSLPCPRCSLGPRKISNSVTAAQDLNSVYGVSNSMLKTRRTMVGGTLKSQIINGEELFALERANGSTRYRCFEGKCELSAMDVRNLLAPTGLAFALVFHRNHNRHARIISTLQPNWSDEQIFQEARKWNIAEYQHCVYNEYLASLIGTEYAEYFGISPKPLGYFTKYDSAVELKTVIEFQTTAGRQGHATLVEDLTFIEPISQHEFTISLRHPELLESIFTDGYVDALLLAEMSKAAFETSPSIPFKTFVTDRVGLDLAALDIQRQRDHGMPGYIYYLKHCHDVDVRSWDDLLQVMDSENVDKLKEHYKYVEDVELYVGGHYERKIADAIVGPTFASIIGIQFYNAKYGDRFFYEHGNQISSFSIEQLNEIKTKSTFASIMCKNTGLERVLCDPFRLESSENEFVLCSEYDDIDYSFL